MKLGMLIFLAVACASLSACITAEERAAQKSSEEQLAQVEREKRCASFGYKQGSPDYSRCLENLYVQDQQLSVAKEAAENERRHRASEALKGAAAALQNISPPPSPVVHCNTMPNGIGTSTTCF